MYRIDTDGSVNGQFSDGDPAQGVPGTKVDAEWMNALQEELCNVVGAAGVALSKAVSNQLAAVVALLARAQTWTARQTFNGGCTVPASTPGSSDAAQRAEVDAAIATAQTRMLKACAYLTCGAGGAVAVDGSAKYNVASASYSGPVLTVNFATPMSTAFYVVAPAFAGVPGVSVSPTNQVTASCGLACFNTSTGAFRNWAQYDNAHVLVFGDFAG